MILYLDTSSMVKLFFTEADCDATRACAGAADMLATSQVAYAETMAAFARRHREGGLDDDQLGVLIKCSRSGRGTDPGTSRLKPSRQVIGSVTASTRSTKRPAMGGQS